MTRIRIERRTLASGADKITRRIQRHPFDCGIDCHAPGTGWQIRRDEGGNPEREESGHVKLEAAGRRAVIRVGFHSLRHSFVSLCRAANAPLAVVEAIVGHTNPAMTRHYGGAHIDGTVHSARKGETQDVFEDQQ